MEKRVLLQLLYMFADSACPSNFHFFFLTFFCFLSNLVTSARFGNFSRTDFINKLSPCHGFLCLVWKHTKMLYLYLVYLETEFFSSSCIIILELLKSSLANFYFKEKIRIKPFLWETLGCKHIFHFVKSLCKISV